MISKDNVKDLFDYRDGKLFWTKTVNARAKAGSEAGTINGRGYRQICYKGKLCMTHRVVWLWHTGQWPKGDVDHISGNKLENRIENLRDVDKSTNQTNRHGAQKNNKTGVLGVRSRGNKFLVHYRSKYIGSFLTMKDAVTARTLAEFLDPQHLRTAL